uniref:2-C-methyl-D-erythritol 2,4-cyclodiphosphate synthase n=1 Tax=Tanacetum cinerariifolium TaxID=118510 RepID=A0A699HQ28_TANCI|nr:2-C-methyl-D-erythritol 2,4-cyclodiphosphate synthase, chloroplastic [Tanacetum cinerariifolium]
MATSSPIYTTSPLHTTTKTLLTRFPTRRSSLTLQGNENRAVVVVKAVVEAENVTAVKKNIPAKVLPFRVGHGFDLHRLEPGYPLIIGGIDIPHERGCEAHSDGDVLLHCVVDAILGALGLPDIGQIFPDSDPKWKGAASSVFIKEANVSVAYQTQKEMMV